MITIKNLMWEKEISMFCSKCGNQLRENIHFCPFCGAAVNNVQSDNAQTVEETPAEVEEKPAEQVEQVLFQEAAAVKPKKKSKGKIAAIIILIFEIALICGVFIFFNVYDFDSGDDDDETTSLRYSLDEANENAELAYNAVRSYFDNTFHIEDDIGHGLYTGAIDVKTGRLKNVLKDVVDDGYVRILLRSSDYYDTSFVLQWCGDESGNGIVGQYPEAISDDYKDNVVFGKIFDPAQIWAIQNDFTTNFEDYFYFKYDGNGDIIITGYHPPEATKDVFIPESYNGSKIAAIHDYAFMRRSVESVTISGNVKEIGEMAFMYCNSLKTVEILDGVEKINSAAFAGCENLETVKIAGSVEEIGPSAFFNCKNLKTVKLSKGIEKIDNLAFYDCDSLKEIKIPDSVETMGNYVFEGCRLEEVDIPDSVEKIGYYAFSYCRDLEEVNFEGGYRFVFKNILTLPSAFLCSIIFYEYLAKVIAIGILVITIITLLIIRHHKKRKELKAKIMLNEENPS